MRGCLTWDEIQKGLTSGVKYRLYWWNPSTYIYFNEDCETILYDDKEEFIPTCLEARFRGWEEYKEPEDNYGKDPRMEWAEMHEDERGWFF